MRTTGRNEKGCTASSTGLTRAQTNVPVSPWQVGSKERGARAAAVSAPTGGHGFGSLCVWRKGLLAGSARIVTLQLQRRPPCAGICVLVVSVHSAMFHPWRRLPLGGRDRWLTGSEAERGRLLPAATYADAVAHVSDSISMGAPGGERPSNRLMNPADGLRRQAYRRRLPAVGGFYCAPASQRCRGPWRIGDDG